MQLETVLAVMTYSTTKAAAYAMGLSVETVHNHLCRLYKRIGVHNFTHAVILLWPILGDEYEFSTKS